MAILWLIVGIVLVLDAASFWFIPRDFSGNDGGSVIQCTQCQASSPVHFDRKENLVGSWNRRALSLQDRSE